jgi:hypothetical protein
MDFSKENLSFIKKCLSCRFNEVILVGSNYIPKSYANTLIYL